MADRQDLFQEIVLQVWRSVKAFRGESSVSTWMYRVALNTATAWTRKQDRHQRGKQPLQTVDGLLALSATQADPRVEWLYRQIAQLKDVDRSVALLMLEGYAYKEIAAIVGISEGNVGVKINRFKAVLTAQLARKRTHDSRRPNEGLALAGLLAALWRGQEPVAADAAAGTGEARETAAEGKMVHVRGERGSVDHGRAVLRHPDRSNQPATFSVRLTVWDYVVGVVGVAAALILGSALFAAGRSRQAREQGFGDSLRVTCGVVSRSSTPRRRVSAAWR